MTNYTRGRAFEYRVKHDLESKGYYCVRAAGSHSKVDVAAFKHDIAVLVQCKANGTISPGEWATLYDVGSIPTLLPVFAERVNNAIVYWLVDNRRKPRRSAWTPFSP